MRRPGSEDPHRRERKVFFLSTCPRRGCCRVPKFCMAMYDDGYQQRGAGMMVTEHSVPLAGTQPEAMHDEAPEQMGAFMMV